MLIKTETRVLEIGLSIWNGFPGVDCFDDIGGPDARDGHDVFELEDEIASGDSWVLSVEDVTTEWGFGEDLTGDSSIPAGRDAQAAYEQYIDSLAQKYNVSPYSVQQVVYRHPEDLDQFNAIRLMREKAWIKERQLDRKSSDADE